MEITKLDFKKLYYESGRNDQEVADQLGVSKSQLRYAVRKFFGARKKRPGFGKLTKMLGKPDNSDPVAIKQKLE